MLVYKSKRQLSEKMGLKPLKITLKITAINKALV